MDGKTEPPESPNTAMHIIRIAELLRAIMMGTCAADGEGVRRMEQQADSEAVSNYADEQMKRMTAAAYFLNRTLTLGGNLFICGFYLGGAKSG